MSKSIIGEQLRAEMSEAGAVRNGRVSLKHLNEGLLHRSSEFRNASREYLARSDAALEVTSLDTHAVRDPSKESNPRLDEVLSKQRLSNKKKKVLHTRKSKPRFGLPEGFRPRLHQHGRSVLLEDNVYRLPGGQEFIPKYPTGTLGKPSHLYALLTVAQFVGGRRGSVYVRTDGRIFDYGVDHMDPSRDMFDTGYTIYDLERTGRYAPNDASKKRQNENLKSRRLAHAG